MVNQWGVENSGASVPEVIPRVPCTRGAALLDFVFTVCDNAAGEVCPYWPGQPMTAHWGVPDPAAAGGSVKEKWLAFRETFRALDNRIKIFSSLPFAQLDRIKLQERLDAIGSTRAPELK